MKKFIKLTWKLDATGNSETKQFKDVPLSLPVDSIKAVETMLDGSIIVVTDQPFNGGLRAYSVREKFDVIFTAIKGSK